MQYTIPTPHDRRRGSSMYRAAPGYAEADAIEDRLERQRALDAIRHAADRAERPPVVPSAHQTAAILADAIGLALADPEIRDLLASRLGHHIRRATRARGLDPRHAETKRVLGQRMRPNPLVEEVERRERIEAEIAAAKRQRTATYEDTIRLLAALRDDDDAE